MSDTAVILFMAEDRTGWQLRLTDLGEATVLNNSPNGDTLAEGAPGQYTATVSEALAGSYEAGLFDDSGACRGRGVVTLADDAGPYYCEDPSTAAKPGDTMVAGTVSDKTGYSLHGDYDAAKTAATQTSVNTISTNVTTALGRLGAWTGTGVNTILGAFKALLSKVASAPSDIGGTFDPASHSTEAIAEAVDAIEGGGGGGGDCPTLPEIVSALADRHIVISSPVNETGTIEIWQGDDYADEDLQIPIEDYPYDDPSGYQELKFGLMLTSAYNAGTGEAALEVDATGELNSTTAVFTIELTDEQTEALTPSPALDSYNYTYQLRAVFHNGTKRTLTSGAATVKRKVVE